MLVSFDVDRQLSVHIVNQALHSSRQCTTPTKVECVNWVKQAWGSVSQETIMKS